jgi:hypothetical protein
MNGEGSSTWKYVGIGCAILALIAACSLTACFACAGAGIGAGIAATEEPANATRSFFGHVRAGQIELAHAETSSGLRARYDVAQLRAALAGMPELAASTDQTISQRNVQAGVSATMGGTLEGPSGGTSFSATLVQEGGVWRIDGLTVAGRAL